MIRRTLATLALILALPLGYAAGTAAHALTTPTQGTDTRSQAARIYAGLEVNQWNICLAQ